MVAAPSLTSVTPSHGEPAGGDTLTITGSNLSNATAVTVGGQNAAILTNSATQITATSPAGMGTVDVSVTTAGGSNTSVNAFTYTAGGAHVITNLNPNFAPLAGGIPITISGSGFTGATAVTFDGVGAGSYTVDSDNQITAFPPAGTGTTSTSWSRSLVDPSRTPPRSRTTNGLQGVAPSSGLAEGVAVASSSRTGPGEPSAGCGASGPGG